MTQHKKTRKHTHGPSAKSDDRWYSLNRKHSRPSVAVAPPLPGASSGVTGFVLKAATGKSPNASTAALVASEIDCAPPTSKSRPRGHRQQQRHLRLQHRHIPTRVLVPYAQRKRGSRGFCGVCRISRSSSLDGNQLVDVRRDLVCGGHTRWGHAHSRRDGTHLVVGREPRVTRGVKPAVEEQVRVCARRATAAAPLAATERPSHGVERDRRHIPAHGAARERAEAEKTRARSHESLNEYQLPLSRSLT